MAEAKAAADKAEAKAAKSGEKPAGKPAKKAAPKAAAGEKAPAAEKGAKPEAAPAAPAVPVAPVEEFSLDPSAGEKPKIVKAKGFKNINSGIAHIVATFNNTIVTITDLKGNVISWSSAGKCGFRGSKKSTAYVAQVVAQDASRQAMGHGLREVAVKVKGPGMGREAAIRALQAIGLEVTSITDETPVPHNGCRPRKQRRV